MSSLVVKVVEFDLRPHPNADMLMLATPRGMAWCCCVGKESMERASLAVYIPIDSILPYDLACFLLPNNRTLIADKPYRIRTLKLRKRVSQGLLVSIDEVSRYLDRMGLKSTGFKLGDDLADLLGITKAIDKYPDDSELMENPPGFINWTDVESYNTFSHLLRPGTEVTLTEKLHGQSLKCGWVSTDRGPEFYVGSKFVCFKPGADNAFTEVANRLSLRDMMADHVGWVLFGELFGPGVQKRMHYGLEEKGFQVFGVFNGERFLNADELVAFCDAKGLTMVPVLYRGPWNESLLSHADGRSTLTDHIREGFVVTPVAEEFSEEIGRVILKVVGQDFLLKNYDE